MIQNKSITICFNIQFYFNPMLENRKDPIEKSKNPTKTTRFSNAEKLEKTRKKNLHYNNYTGQQ